MTGTAAGTNHRSGQRARNLRSHMSPSVRARIYRETLLAAAKRTEQALHEIALPAIWQRAGKRCNHSAQCAELCDEG